MNWIPDFIKQLSISTGMACSAFFATATLLVAPELKVTFVKPAPSEWQWVIVLVCVFSGCLIVINLLSAVPKVFKRQRARYLRCLRFNPLSEGEKELLSLIALLAPNSSFDLRDAAGNELKFLDVLKDRDGLEKKGLITVAFDENYVTLTAEGRKVGRDVVLETQKLNEAGNK